MQAVKGVEVGSAEEQFRVRHPKAEKRQTNQQQQSSHRFHFSFVFLRASSEVASDRHRRFFAEKGR